MLALALYAHADWSDNHKLHVPSLDGSSVVKVADNPGTSLAFSPDGTELAHLRDDSTADCLHVEVVHTDGSDASPPTRIRDCSRTGEMITDLAWSTGSSAAAERLRLRRQRELLKELLADKRSFVAVVVCSDGVRARLIRTVTPTPTRGVERLHGSGTPQDAVHWL